jgi:DNA-binding response OmpR family regulator
VPIIMLTGYGERSRVVEAVQIGVNEFLLKPVSSKALQDRLVAVLANPRPMVQIGDYYGPAPRKLASIHVDGDEAVAKLANLQLVAQSGNRGPVPRKAVARGAAVANRVLLD